MILESRKILVSGGYNFTNFNVPPSFDFATLQNNNIFKP
jgi:hypothetical protein